VPRITLESGLLRAKIDPRLGAGIAELSLKRVGGEPLALMRPAPPEANWFNDLACYVLAPWSNRIRGGLFVWQGRTIQLDPDWPDGTAIHGVVKDKPFRMVERSPVSVTLGCDLRGGTAESWPWAFGCGVRYSLGERSLHARLRVTRAPTDRPGAMPVGLGFHPFFPRTLADPRDQVVIRYAPSGRYPAQSMIPTGPTRCDETTRSLVAGSPLGSSALDDVFLGSTDGAEIIWPASGVRLRYSCSECFGHGVVYTGRPDSSGAVEPAFCLEPVSMVNDGFNLHSRGWKNTGVRSLLPGESLEGRWSVEVLT
jgi:aldose 1-epimerase